jgi:hypothetical protein
MEMAATLRTSKNYDLFELHKFNRDVTKTRFLEGSMRKYGWRDAYPMDVVRNGKKLKIKAGHHRFEVAQKLGIPVKFVVCTDDISIHELERATNPWKLKDFMVSHARCGKPEYVRVKDYHDNTGIPLASAISMLTGASAGTRRTNEFKFGDFKITSMEHAHDVATVVMHCKKHGISWAANNKFVSALSRILLVKEVDMDHLKHKISTFAHMVEKQPTIATYAEMLEKIYNRQSKTKIPLVFLANEEARKRSAGSPTKQG